MFAVNGGDVFIFANGNIRKVPRYNVQLSENRKRLRVMIPKEMCQK